MSNANVVYRTEVYRISIRIYYCRLIIVVIDDNNEKSLSKETNRMKSSCLRYDDLLINECMHARQVTTHINIVKCKDKIYLRPCK